MTKISGGKVAPAKAAAGRDKVDQLLASQNQQDGSWPAASLGILGYSVRSPSSTCRFTHEPTQIATLRAFLVQKGLNNVPSARQGEALQAFATAIVVAVLRQYFASASSRWSSAASRGSSYASVATSFLSVVLAINVAQSKRDLAALLSSPGGFEALAREFLSAHKPSI